MRSTDPQPTRFTSHHGSGDRTGGRTLAGHAELEDDPDQVALGYMTLLEQLGRKPREVGLKVNVPRSPTIEELKPALTGRRIVRVRLDD